MESQAKVWYVTGAAEGLGLNLVKQLLTAGYRVAATAENIKDLQRAVGDTTAHFLALQVNLSSEESVITSLQEAVDTFGKIDVIVNNAERSLSGSIEALSDKQARANFEINVFGMMNVIRNAMPHFRKQESGHIFNVSSSSGFKGQYPGLSIYCATKFAVVGLSESLALEAKPFGIQVTIVLPDQFRNNIEQQQDQQSFIQLADPENNPAAMINLAEIEEPPLYLFMSKSSFQAAAEKLERVKKEMCLWQNA